MYIAFYRNNLINRKNVYVYKNQKSNCLPINKSVNKNLGKSFENKLASKYKSTNVKLIFSVELQY